MNFLDILRGTPYWVWILFGYLLVSGIKASKPAVVSLVQLSIMPLIFLLWSLYSLYNKCTNCSPLLIIWLVALLVGIVTGYRFLSRKKIIIDSETKLIHLPVSYIPLILSLVFFLGKYTLGVTYALNPLMKSNVIVLSLDVLLSGLITGISIGRFMKFFHATSRAA